MKDKTRNKFLWFLLLISLIFSIRVLALRIPNEKASNQVELALEYADLVEIAKRTNQEPIDLVEQAQSWGMTSLVLLDEDFLEPAAEVLQYAKENNLILVPQLSNQLDEKGFTDLDGVLTVLFTLPNSHMFFFSGYEAYAFDNEINAVTFAQIINLRRATIGVVEFLGEQEGLERYLGAAGSKVVRIHPGYPYDTREELILSVTDRNVRFLFLKPFKHMDMEAGKELSSLEFWLNQTANDIVAKGFQLGQAKPIEGLVLSPTMFLYLILGIFAALGIIIGLLFDSIKEILIAVFVAVLIALSYASYIYNLVDLSLLFNALAILAALAFPTLGVLLFVKDLSTREKPPNISHTLFYFVASTAITLSGGSIVNALLSETAYLNALLTLRGIKLAFVLPLGLTSLLLIARLVKLALNKSFKENFSFKNLLKLSLLFLIVYLYIWRSGNEGAIGQMEQGLRVILQKTFGVRPRFKEFLTGYPALMLLSYFYHKPWLSILLTVLATAGQVSIFNTFLHVHTPLLLSWQRIAYGLVIGLVLAFLALAIVKAMGLDKKTKF